MATIPEGELPLRATCRLLMGDGNGAGFLLTHDGLVATCAHAAYEGQTVRVQIDGDRVYTGRVVACRASRDLALVKIEGVTGLSTVRLGDVKAITPGDRLHVLTYEQLPQSTMVATGFPDGERTARVSRPLALEVGFAGILFVGATAEDSGFRCLLTTRTDQV
ncbi:serine protease, partial [bacterium]